MPVTHDQIIDALRPVEDPEIHRSIVELGMVRSIDPRRRRQRGRPHRPHRPRLPAEARDHQTACSGAVAALDGVTSVAVDFTVMTDQEREALRIQLQGDGHGQVHSQAHGHAEGRAIPFAQPGSRTRPLFISSGKGGVGKSSVTTNLAVALAARGHSVGIVDADIYGFSIPRMLGAEQEPMVIDQMLLPPEAWGVRCISIGYFVPEGQAVVWRGPMLHKALEQFLTDVFWDDPDFLLVDMPPGTGDIAISLSQYLPRGEVYVVTTPQPAAQKVARLSAAMAAKVNLTVRGVIENMSWFTGDDGVRYELFGAGGGAELAAELDVPLLAQLPLVPALRAGGDEGKPIAAVDPDSETGRAFHDARRAHRRRAAAEEGLQLGAQDQLTSAPWTSSRATASSGSSPTPSTTCPTSWPRCSTTWSSSSRTATPTNPTCSGCTTACRTPSAPARRARTSSASTAWRCARCARTRTTSPRRCT